MSTLTVFSLLISILVGVEIACLGNLDPVCVDELDQFEDSYTDEQALGDFINTLYELALNVDVLTSIAPHIIQSIANLPTTCNAARVLNYPLDVDLSAPNIDEIVSSFGFSSLESGQDQIVNENLFLSATKAQQYLHDRVLLNNEFYDTNLLQTLQNIHDSIKPDFDAIGFDDESAVTVIFSLAACGDIPIKKSSICGSLGYGFAIANNEIKFLTSANADLSIGLGGGLPFGLSFYVSFDFSLLDNVDGYSSSLFVNVDPGTDANGLNYFHDKIVPLGVGFNFGYSGLIPGIDCDSIGFSITVLDTSLGFGLNGGISVGSTTYIQTENDNSDNCIFDFTSLGEIAISGSCIIHQNCANHGFGLSDVACCDNTCTQKVNGFCPGHAIGSDCCVSTDCANNVIGFNGLFDDIACCKFKCTKKSEDFLGVKVCPNLCRAGLHCLPGSCGENTEQYDACVCSEQCGDGMSCCKLQCRYKETEEITGIKYCPALPHIDAVNALIVSNVWLLSLLLLLLS